jgi:short-subunit dehydrogenase
MKSPLDSGTVLITGACSDLGRAIARQLSRRARTLVLVAGQEEELEALREELEAGNPTLGTVLLPCDVSRPGEVDAVLAELARQFISVDVLVNAAATGEQALFARQPWTDIERMLQVNVSAPLLLTHRLLEPMVARGSGGILHIGSGAGQLFLPGAATYAATRRCLDGFFESLRLEVEGTGVIITQVAPGPMGGAVELAERDPTRPWPFFQISFEQCAREALLAFERREPLVYPGRGHRWVMTLLPRLPRAVRRALGRWVERDLRERTEAAQLDPNSGARGLISGGTVPA